MTDDGRTTDRTNCLTPLAHTRRGVIIPIMQILHYNKHLYHSCWYLKGTVYRAVASCETISGDYKSAMAQVTCAMEYGICTLGTLGYKSHTTRNPWYNYSFTLYSLQCTLQPTIPTNQSYYSQHTSTHNHSKTTNRELWCVWLERSM